MSRMLAQDSLGVLLFLKKLFQTAAAGLQTDAEETEHSAATTFRWLFLLSILTCIWFHCLQPSVHSDLFKFFTETIK